ncbi:hypothetical protein V9T40_014047 [Parthenolecanium corni]|uniref:Uncharacterized protein n=1 Tax=Parthenolecanium corni TaxID=536013 RepID=A0AAN9TDX2_9HEMI
MSENSSSGNPRGSIHLQGALICPSDEDSHTFSVNSSSGEMFKLRATDARARQEWVNKLRSVAEYHSSNVTKYVGPKETVGMFLHSGVFVHGSHIHSPATSESFAAAKEHLAEAEQKCLKIGKNIDSLPAQGDLDSTFHRCCSLGQNKTLNPLKCESKIRTPVIGVAIEEQSLCLSTVELCCVQALRNTSCKNGKQAAKSGRSCTTDFRTEEDLSFRYCCEACKVGIIAGSMSMCNLKTFKFDPPWDQIYKSCCEEPIRGPDNPLPATSPETSNVCDIFPGELCHHICIPVNSSYRCQCRSGFSLLADGKSCREEVGNRCDRNNPCDQQCFDNGTSVECSCYSGFILLPDHVSCEDIDECKDGTHKCNLQTHSCINYAGGHRCEPKNVKTQVPFGFKIDPKTNETVDINECSSKPCKLNEVCFNTIGSFKCECLKGFSWNAVTSSCIDIDECATGLHNCNSLSKCVNFVGSYQCVPTEPKSSTEQQNPPGFTFDSKTNRFVDINECDSKPCGSYEVCNNTVGSYSCTCAHGFTRDRITDACVDINECQTKRDDCNPDFQRCDNTIGSYQCVRVASCGTGYTFNSQSLVCEDDDECTLETHNCHTLGPDYECKNSAGSFRCVPKKKCTNPQICGHFSTQQCPAGYLLIDGKCADVNECTSGSACPQGYNCQNTPGSFRCFTNRIVCSNGLRLDKTSNRCVGE